MRILNQNFSWNSFEKECKEAKNKLLCLDYDGTLAPFHYDPQQAKPYEGVIDLIQEALQKDNVKVAILSGRALSDLKQLMPFADKLELWGSHGMQRQKSGESEESKSLTADEQAELDEAKEAVASMPVRQEEKPASFAVHFRELDEAQTIKYRNEVKALWRKLLQHLEIHEFDEGVEARSKRCNKGHIVETLLHEASYDSVAYLGDDYTDEDAFARLGETGARVLVREEWRDTYADLWIKPPDELYQFISGFLRGEGFPELDK